jgi:hypothetical protein
LSHEFVHVVVASLAGRTVPAWLNEGLATVLEPSVSEDAEAPLARVGAYPDVSKLHQPFVTLAKADAETAYASAARRQTADPATRRERHGCAVARPRARNALRQRLQTPNGDVLP